MGPQEIFIISVYHPARQKTSRSLPRPPESGIFPIDKSPLSDYNTQESVIVLFFMSRRVL